MLANIQNYRPEEVKFVLTDAVKEKFPVTLFDGAENPDEVIKEVSEKFNAIFPDKEGATRFLDDFEVQEIREEYCLKQEDEIPKRMLELEEALETAKRIKKDAEERYSSLLLEIRELAAKVKGGTKDFNLSSKYTFRIALDGYFLFYSWVDNKFQLAKALRIPEWDKRGLWSQEEKNRQAMMDLFGYEFPEVAMPTPEDDEIEEF